VHENLLDLCQRYDPLLFESLECEQAALKQCDNLPLLFQFLLLFFTWLSAKLIFIDARSQFLLHLVVELLLFLLRDGEEHFLALRVVP
jgi:hypothetical protein